MQNTIRTFKDDAERALSDFLAYTEVTTDDAIRSTGLRRLGRRRRNYVLGRHLGG